MNDKKIYLNKEKGTILLSKEEVKKLFEQVRHEYLREKKIRPAREDEPNYNSRKHHYLSVYYG